MNTSITAKNQAELRLHDLEPALATMHSDVLDGLRSTPKFLPSQYLYDERGAKLFEEICDQPEYYITRTEISILENNMASIAEHIGPRALLIEPGSGEGTKSALMLEGMNSPAGFVPIDISREQLMAVSESISEQFAEVEVAPMCADFTDDPQVPNITGVVRRRVVFFPGSTIGNLVPEHALDVLRHLRTLCGDGGCVLVGVDLKKSREVLESAYDDAAGVSRAFALNYLERLNKELGANFDLTQFDYEAPYDAKNGRVEMALVSQRDQEVDVEGERTHFAAGERVRTEYSYKYELSDFLALAEEAELVKDEIWTDADELFAVVLLRVV